MKRGRYQLKDIPTNGVLRAVADDSYHWRDRFSEFPKRLLLAKVLRLCDEDLLEYGTSPSLVWLTPNARERLADGEVVVE